MRTPPFEALQVRISATASGYKATRIQQVHWALPRAGSNKYLLNKLEG
jgi:hypothetical protein